MYFTKYDYYYLWQKSINENFPSKIDIQNLKKSIKKELNNKLHDESREI